MLTKIIWRYQQYYRVINNYTTVLQQLHTSHTPLLAGHSKWANIKHIKAEKDGDRAALFSKISRQIRLAIQEGGSPDPVLNSQLRTVMEQATRQSMPMASIQNSIKKSQQNKNELKRYLLEMRVKQKVFAICVAYTDNFAAVKMEAAPILKKAGATFVPVNHMFDSVGLIEAILDNDDLSNEALEDRITEDAIECEVEEFEIIDSKLRHINFICNPVELLKVSRAIEIKGYKVQSTEHMYTPKNTVELTTDEFNAYKVFVKKLCDVQGIEDVYDNIQTN